MENVKIISDNGIEINVNGIFYIFDSKYYFIYTEGELDENEYVKLYLVQVCKEVQNTPTGPVDTGYMLGMEITDQAEWQKVQGSITEIVNDKKNGTQSSQIQYLPMNMLVNLKITSKNKFKLMKHIIEENFKVTLPVVTEQTVTPVTVTDTVIPIQPVVGDIAPVPTPVQPVVNDIAPAPTTNENEIIIDYRAKFFEEQEKNQELEEQLKQLQEKLNSIKNIIG